MPFAAPMPMKVKEGVSSEGTGDEDNWRAELPALPAEKENMRSMLWEIGVTVDDDECGAGLPVESEGKKSVLDKT